MANNYCKPILKLGFPIMLGQIGIIITSFADTMMVGHYTTQALASSSFVNNLFIPAMTACGGFTLGLTPLVGALFTQKRYEAIGLNVKTSALLTLVFAALVALVMTGIYLNLEKLGQPADLYPTIRPYYLLFIIGLFPVAIFNVFAQWSYAITKTMAPAVILIICNAVNILGNYMLIYGNFGAPEMGLTGAGISTLVSRLLAMMMMGGIFFFFKEFRHYRESFLKTKLDSQVTRRVFKTSWPIAAQMTLESGSFSFAAIMAGWIGTISLAAFQVIMIIGMLGFMIYSSFGSAVAILVANKGGTADTQAQRNVAMSGMKIQFFIATFISIVFIFFSQYLIPLFSSDKDVVLLTISLVIPLVLYQYGDCSQINFCNALRGTSNVMPMMWVAGIAYIIVGIPAMYLFGFIWNMETYGLIVSFSVSLFLAAALYIYFFFRSTRPSTSEKI